MSGRRAANASSTFRQTGQSRQAPVAPVAPAKAGAQSLDARLRGHDKKLARELAELPGRIEKLESEQAVLSTQLSDPDLYTREREKARAMQDRLAAIERELGEAYRRWEALEQQS